MTQDLSTTPQLDPRTLLIDMNVRHSINAGKDLIASVREVGVLQPIIAVRTVGGQVRVRYGHRRTLAAIHAELPTVPVLIVADEGTDDAAQVERLGHPVGRKPAPGRAEQRRTGRRDRAARRLRCVGRADRQAHQDTRTTVNAALTVMGCELARHATARYDWLDLEQAAVVAEIFEDDPEAVTALIAAAKTGQFDHVAQRIRDTRAQKTRKQAKTEDSPGRASPSSTAQCTGRTPRP